MSKVIFTFFIFTAVFICTPLYGQNTTTPNSEKANPSAVDESKKSDIPKNLPKNDPSNIAFGTKKLACLGTYTIKTCIGNTRGAQITEFTSTSAGEAAGLRIGDIIIRVNSVEVLDHKSLRDIIGEYPPLDKVTVEYERAGVMSSLEATLDYCTPPTPLTGLVLPAKDSIGQGKTVVVQVGEPLFEPVHSVFQNLIRAESLGLRDFVAYPNPTTGLVYLGFQSSEKPVVVSIYNLFGVRLFSEEISAFKGTYAQNFDLSAHPSGTLFVVVQQDGTVFSERILLQKL